MPKNVAKSIQVRGLEEIVKMLNGENDGGHPLYDETRENLIAAVRAWQTAKTAVHPMERHESMPAGARVPVLLKIVFPPTCPIRTWPEIAKHCKPIPQPVGSGAHWSVVYDARQFNAWDHALNLFLSLVTNPERDKLAGPCARATCGKYYIMKRASQKAYCSRTCGNAATAIARTREKWDNARKERLALAEKALKRWSGLKTTESFGDWAEKRYPRLTKKFITRAVGNDELPEPTKRS